MSDKKKKSEKSGVEKHKENILKMIGGMKAVDTYIEGFSQSGEHQLTEQQKQYMRHYAEDFAEKWSETIYKMEQALKNPDVVNSLERKVKAMNNREKNKAKE
jgi:ubiquinone biosynthesis protein UbiJ